MLSLEDHTMLADFAKAEEEEPSPYKKIDESHTIYKSRRFRPPIGGQGYGLPILCDFGEARIGSKQETGPFIQPHTYRAPEVIFEMPWGSAVDIWNLACLVGVPSLGCHDGLHGRLTHGRSGTYSKDNIYLEISLTPRVAMIHSSISR